LPYWQGNAVADDWELLRWTLLIEAEKKDMFCLLTLNRSGFRTNKEKQNNGAFTAIMI
jgi:hypothetical protein